MLAVPISDFSHEGVFSFSSVSNMRMWVSSIFPKTSTSFYISFKEAFNYFYLLFFSLMVWRRLFPFKNNLAVCAVNFIFYWFFTYPHSLLHLQTLLIPFHFSTNIQLFHLLTKQNKNNEKHCSHDSSEYLNVNFYLFCFFYQHIYQKNVTLVYFTLKYSSIGFWNLPLSHFLNLMPQKSVGKNL